MYCIRISKNFRFITKKWIEVYHQSGKNYSLNKEIRVKTSMLRSDLCDFSDTYVVAEGTITYEGDNNANKRNKNLAFKNNAPFIKEMNQVILFLLILKTLNTREVL